MSAVEVESGRPRPLSGGLWTLFSWLRRDEHSSSESLSSVGSDRTVASIAFLQPGHYATANPIVIPPPGPPTDSYRKRVRDRNIRRQHDRDITLLRKYGLHGFDAFSLPNARRTAASERTDRDRRAASELFQRPAHVPGKRRAPPPPSTPSTLARRRTRKRPAPQPPLPVPTIPEKLEEDEDHIQLNNTINLPMNTHSQPVTDHSPKLNEVTMGCKSEKYSKKETNKEVKPRQDKSFLKQIFENKKRNSAIETSSVKLLPSISELDKQAHEIMEKYKLKVLEHNPQDTRTFNDPGPSSQTDAWICTRCLKKYNATVITCLYCLPLENALLNNTPKSSRLSSISTQTASSDQKNDQEEKEKLKEILKEMKDSLPKKGTGGPYSEAKSLNDKVIKSVPKVVEPATLKIGSSIKTVIINKSELPPTPKTNTNKDIRHDTNAEPLATINNVLITKPTVLEHTKDNIVIVEKKVNNQKQSLTKKDDLLNKHVTKTELASKLLNGVKVISNLSGSAVLDTKNPLKVSSLLNPIYIPKSTNETVTSNLQSVNKKSEQESKSGVSSTRTNSPTCSTVLPSTPQTKLIFSNALLDKTEEKRNNEPAKTTAPKENKVMVKKVIEPSAPVNPVTQPTTSRTTSTEISIVEKLDQHSRRRNLINQLEQSIAKGDEGAAAEAAVKLAQLRLSCSVLSFSSQIVAGPSRISASPENPHAIEPNSKQNTEEILKTPIKNTNSADKIITRDTRKVVVTKRENDTQTSAQIVPTATKAKTDIALTQPSPPKSNVRDNKAGASTSTTAKIDTNVVKGNNEDVPILVWVEDKETTRGPVQLHVKRNARMGDLRRQAERSLGLAVHMQRWIVGRALCSDEDTLLVTLAGQELSAPFYLCLVEADTKEVAKTVATNNDAEIYNELVKLEQQSLVTNAEKFECAICMEECTPGNGAILRECVHSFCKECLSDVVRHSEEPVVSCPASDCRGVLEEREIKGLVSGEDYEKWLARGLAVAESGTRNAFHCRTKDCTGWALCEPGVRRFPCPVCKSTNCVPCQAIHAGETCEQHRKKLEAASAANDSTNQTDEGTRALLDSLIARGEALQCPECSAIITKKWGCDWIKCSACKTEICWVTRGRRWGAAGKGDTSGGCRCGVDGKKCHPSCGYCH